MQGEVLLGFRTEILVSGRKLSIWPKIGIIYLSNYLKTILTEEEEVESCSHEGKQRRG